MLKFKYTLALFTIFLLGVFPFLNGFGCNAVMEMETAFFKMKGRCEHGIINATFYNKRMDETYSIYGRLAKFGSSYFIVTDNMRTLQTSDEITNTMRRYAYHRKLRTGRLIDNKYILAYTPFALMGEIKITGRLSIL